MVVEKNAMYVIIARLSYITLIAILLSILANIFAYFSQTKEAYSDSDSHISYSLDYHTPIVNWSQPTIANGRILEQFDRREITRAYQNAWYIAFKDKNVRIKRKVRDGSILLYEEELYKSYDVVMTLSDGKWRILHMKEIENLDPMQKTQNSAHFVMDSIVTFVGNVDEPSVLKPIVNCNAKPKDGFHKLEKGETLYKLSKKYNTSVKQIMKWNQVKDISDIKICSHIRVKSEKNGRRKIVLVTPRVQKNNGEKNLVVKKNESIFLVAKRLKMEASILKEYNKLESYELEEGQILKIPNLLDINKSVLKDIKGIY